MDDHEPLGGGDPGSHDPGMEARLARAESDIRHIKSDISEIKGVLGRLVPRIDEIYGKIAHLATKEDLARHELATKEDFARLELSTKEDIARLAAETREAPDAAANCGRWLIGALITSGTRLAH